MDENKPLISVIVRTKDRPKLLKKALASISAQTYRPLEVILVNDGGCDLDTRELNNLLQGVALNYIRCESNGGRAHAGNIGIQNSTGQYIGFLDDDDEFYPDHIETLASCLEGLDYKVAYADTEMAFFDYDAETNELRESARNIFSSNDYSYRDLLLENYIPLISILFTRDLLCSLEGFDEAFEIYEDWELLVRCGQTAPFYHVRKVTSIYKQWSGELQIAQSKEYWSLATQAYDMVVGKHKEKFTPEVIRYFRDSSSRMKAQLKEVNGLMKKRESALNDAGAYIRDRETVIQDKVKIIEALEARTRQQDVNEISLTSEIERLKEKLEEREAFISKMQSGRGWRLLSAYYRMRDRLLYSALFENKKE